MEYPAPIEDMDAALYAALCRNDAQTCRQLAERAGAEKRLDAVGALCDILRPRGLFQRLRRRGVAWQEARVEAANALTNIGGKTAFRVLAETLLDPDPYLRSHVQTTLLLLDSKAVPALLTVVECESKWTLAGMRQVIETLGQIKDTRATDTLVRVLFGVYPRMSDRHINIFLRIPLFLLASVFAYGILSSYDLIVLVIFGVFIGAGLYLAYVVFIGLPIAAVTESRGRTALTFAAANALEAMQDKRALPGVIEAMSYFGRKAALRRTLASLLPLVRENDRELFNSTHLRHLTQILSSSDAGLVLTVLKAMEFVGNGEAIQPIEFLMKWEERPEISAEAARVLPILQERLRREQDPLILLRASEQPASPPEQLLRPAQSDSQTPPEQLLRPGN